MRMRSSIWPLLLLLWAAKATGDTGPAEEQIRCPRTEDAAGCACMVGLEVELACADGALNVQLERSGLYATLQCDAAIDLSVSTLPRLRHRPNLTLPSVRFDSCSVSSNGTWARVLNALGYESASRVNLAWIPLTSLGVDQISGLNKTERLLIQNPEPRGQWLLSKIFFLSLPSLLRFTVRGANLQLEPDTFVNASTLEWLELSDGTLENIPPMAFKELKSLQRLSLWGLKLKTLPDGMLTGLESLKNLDLSTNALHKISTHTLEGASSLTALDIRLNPLQRIETGAFRTLTSLERIKITDCRGGAALLWEDGLTGLGQLRVATVERCGLTELAEDWLRGVNRLANLSLAHNALRSVPPLLLRDQTMLQRLDLSGNQLTHLPDHVFDSLGALLEINLDGNNIQEISAASLSGLRSLEVLSVRSCGLQRVASMALPGGLRSLLLANNSLVLAAAGADELGPRSPLQHLQHLVRLDLARNKLEYIYADWRTSLSLRYLNLSHNNIQYLTDGDFSFLSSEIEVDLRYNNITTVEMIVFPLEAIHGVTGSAAHIYLDHNPFRCDCRLYNLVERLQIGKIRTAANLEMGAAMCGSPTSLANISLANVPIKELRCNLSVPTCPENCTCSLRPAGLAVELSCSSVPETLPVPQEFGLAVAELRLTSLPREPLELSPQVRLLDLRSLGLAVLPPLRSPPLHLTLDLRNNSLANVPEHVLTLARNRSMHLLLAGNPLSCDCANAGNIATLQKYNSSVKDWSLVECQDELGSTVLVRGAGSEGCHRRGGVALAAVAAGVLLAAAVATALYYRHERAVRVWLTARGWWPEDDDEEAHFDVFVSYAHQDEAWVAGALAPALESGPRPLRLCLHHRDWVPGEWIPAQIARSVAQSRRTLVVLSPHFVESSWGRLEWRAAHVREQREARRRVLVVLTGDVPRERLEPELRDYLATNTYLSRDDPRFWQKLRAALPRHSCAPAPSPPPPYASLVPPSIITDEKSRF